MLCKRYPRLLRRQILIYPWSPPVPKCWPMRGWMLCARGKPMSSPRCCPPSPHRRRLPLCTGRRLRLSSWVTLHRLDRCVRNCSNTFSARGPMPVWSSCWRLRWRWDRVTQAVRVQCWRPTQRIGPASGSGPAYCSWRKRRFERAKRSPWQEPQNVCAIGWRPTRAT